MATRKEMIEELELASKAFDSLLNNDVKTAETILSGRDDCFAKLGLGACRFLAAAMSREEDELQEASETLVEAEASATAELNLKRPQMEPSTYPTDVVYKLLIADASIAQALIAILSESYSGFISGVWKMNKAHKIFSSLAKAVLPDFDSEDSLDTTISRLNDHYIFRKTNPITNSSTSSSGSSFLPWRRSRKDVPLRHASSSPSLPTLRTLDQNARPRLAPSYTALDVREDDQYPNEKVPVSSTKSVRPLWEDDPLTTMVIGGATLGQGMFALIMSILPPKARKVMTWIGFSAPSRAGALKLLTIAATTGQDVHSALASLALLTFYGLILLLSGWQADKAHLVGESSRLLNRILPRFPDGTLWVLTGAKLARYQGKTDEAVKIIVEALEKGSHFQQAESLLVFELAWLYLSRADYVKTANTFVEMVDKNKWSPCTYYGIASGALVEERNTRGSNPQLERQLDELFTRLPTLFEQKKMFGEPPVTESFIKRRLEAHKAKLARWIEAGKVGTNAKIWEVIRISNAMELGLFWSTTGGYSPKDAVRQQIHHFSSMSPPPKYGPNRIRSSSANSFSSATSSNSRSYDISNDLDSLEEIAIRDLLLGTLYSALGDEASLEIAHSYFEEILSYSGQLVEERWVIGFSLFHGTCALLKEGDLKAQRDGVALKVLWKPILAQAEKRLDRMLQLTKYEFKDRLELRAGMLRNEIIAKKERLGL